MNAKPWQVALRADARLDRSPFPVAQIPPGTEPGTALASRRFGEDRRYDALLIAGRYGLVVFVCDRVEVDPKLELPKVLAQLSVEEWAAEVRR